MGMSLYETGSAFLILFFGMLLSLVVIVMEVYVDLYMPILKLRWREKNFTPAGIFSAHSAGSVTESFTQPTFFR